MRRSFCCVLLAALAAGGCQSVPETDPGRDIAWITGTKTQIQFKTEGDAPDAKAVTPELLNLSEATRAALEHDSELQMSLALLQAALAEAKQTRLLPNPVLSVALKFPEASGKPTIDASLTAELLSLIQRPRQISAADARVRAASAQVLVQALEQVNQIQEKYIEIQALQAQIDVLQERRKITDQLIRIADARLKRGEAARLDLLSVQAQMAEIDTDLLDMNAELTDAKLIITRMIGEPSGQTSWRVLPWQYSEEPQLSEAQWAAAALRHRPEIQAIMWELSALGDEEALARWSFIEGSAGATAERDDAWSLGPALEIPLPIFDWGQAKRDKAQAQLAEFRHKLTLTQRQVIEDVRRAWAASQSARLALAEVGKKLIPLQEQRRAQAESQYRNGVADMTAILLAQQDEQAAKSRLITIQKNSSLSHYRLVRAAAGQIPTNTQNDTESNR